MKNNYSQNHTNRLQTIENVALTLLTLQIKLNYGSQAVKLTLPSEYQNIGQMYFYLKFKKKQKNT